MTRLMEKDDIPQLARLFLKGRRHTFHWVAPARFQLEDFEAQTKGERIWVAEQGGNICDFIAIWQPEHFVHHLYVSSDWHGQGIGRALLERGLADSPLGSLKVALATRPHSPSTINLAGTIARRPVTVKSPVPGASYSEANRTFGICAFRPHRHRKINEERLVTLNPWPRPSHPLQRVGAGSG